MRLKSLAQAKAAGRRHARLTLEQLEHRQLLTAAPAGIEPDQEAPPPVAPLIAPIDYTQPGPYLVGSRSATVTRTDGGSGTFTARIFYPATSAGNNTPLDGSGGSYPVVTFAHGYSTSALAEYSLSMSHIASYGYLVVAPTSYESILDVLNTEALGHDMGSAYNYLVAQNSAGASPFFNHVVTTGFAAMGHSMGGAASISEASQNASVKTVVTWAAQNMNTPDAYDQMPNVHVPLQMIAGTQDGVVSASTTTNIYNAGNPPIQLNNLIGGFHFGFEDVGAGPFADSGSMPRATELGYSRSYTVQWLNLYLKGDQSSWRQFWGPERTLDPQVQHSDKSGIAVTAISGVNALNGPGGTVLDYSVRVKNNGDYATSFSLFAEDNSWTTAFSTLQTPVLAAGAMATVHVYVTVPPGSLAGTADDVLISARNDTDGGTRDYVTLLSTATAPPNSSIVGSKLFYKGSTKWNVTNNNLPGFSDDNAIAPDKTAYVANGAAATFANVSSYSRGINGLMVDISGPHGAITANDFIFKVGNNNSPSTWATAPAPTLVTTRSGAGSGGSDRVELLWADNAIEKQWLEVVVRGNDTLGGSNANTALAASGVFFWGSAPGDSGAGDTSGFLVNTTDETSARNDPHGVTNPAAITNVNDFDRNGLVNSVDQNATRTYATSAVTQLKFLTVGAGGPFGPASIAAAGDAGIASALASGAAPPATPSAWPPVAGFVDLRPTNPTAPIASPAAAALADLPAADDELDRDDEPSEPAE